MQKAGWLLDGYPRSASQAEAIVKENITPDVFLLINVPDEVIVDRVVGRRLDPQTGDIYHLTYKPPPAAITDRLVQARLCPPLLYHLVIAHCVWPHPPARILVRECCPH